MVIRDFLHNLYVSVALFICGTIAAGSVLSGCSPPQDIRSDLVGRWMDSRSRCMPCDRFGISIFDFRHDGTFIIQNLLDETIVILEYEFIGPDTIKITGDGYDGTMRISLSGTELKYTAYFDDQPFNQFNFTRRRILEPIIIAPTPTVTARETISESNSHPDLYSIWATEVKSPPLTTETGVVSSSHIEAFAVGEAGTILFYNSSDTWTQMPSPTSQNLRGISGTSSQDIFAVGDNGATIHFDGSTWSMMDSGVSTNLAAVSAYESGSAFAVGEGPTILHSADLTWESVPTNDVAVDKQPFHLSAVKAFSTDNVFVGGTKNTLLHFNGLRWDNLIELHTDSGAVVSPLPPYDRISSLWGTEGDLHAATTFSSSLLMPTENRWVGFNSWNEFNMNIDLPLRSIWSNNRSVFIAGDGGIVIYIDGIITRQLDTQTNTNLFSVSGTRNFVIIVGENGMILQSVFVQETGPLYLRQSPIEWLDEN